MILSLERSTSPPVDLMMELEVRPLHPDFGVEILSVDLSMPLEYERFAQIERAVEHYSVVLFRGQSFDDDSQLAFSRRFGALEYGHVAYGRDRSIEYVGRIGNIDKNGKQLPSKHKKVVFSTGNEMWHSDSSFREVPARLSISYAHEVTPDGGELEFVSTRPAYARLPPDLKETLAHAAKSAKMWCRPLSLHLCRPYHRSSCARIKRPARRTTMWGPTRALSKAGVTKTRVCF
jgi:alpha-ketoglutarate-dependent taurine dioxygenase